MIAPIREFPAPVLVPGDDNGILEPYAVKEAGIGQTYVTEVRPAGGYDIELEVPSVDGFAFASLTGSLGSDTFDAVQSADGQCSPVTTYCTFTYTANQMQFLAEQFQSSVGNAPAVVWHSPSLLADGSGPGPGPERWEIMWYAAASDVTYRFALGGAAVQLVSSGTTGVESSNVSVAQHLSALAATFVPARIGPLAPSSTPVDSPTVVATPTVTLVPPPVLEQLPVTFAGGPARKGNGGLAEQVGPEFSLAGGNYSLAWTAASHRGDYCSVYPDLRSPQQSYRTTEMDIHPGSASAHSSSSGQFPISNLPAGSQYRLVIYSGCDQWTVRLSR